MGISIPFSFRGLISVNRDGENGPKMKKILYKIIKRSVLLFFLGLVEKNTSNQPLSNLRIMGVLQRFAISYLVCALIELAYVYSNNYTINITIIIF